jgi:hypothetical protein
MPTPVNPSWVRGDDSAVHPFPRRDEHFDNSFADNLDKSGFLKELWGNAVQWRDKRS